jgi:imidazolonepropionase-like amidohydrolase
MHETAQAALLIIGLQRAGLAQSPPARETAITHVAVVDVTRGRLLDDQTVIVSGARIARVGPASSITVASGTRILDGRGKFLIPGLWDMHSHVFENSSRAASPDMHALAFPLYIANGVTGVRDMWTTLEEIPLTARWVQAESDGSLIGPRVVPTSTMISGPGRGGEQHTIIVTTPEAGRRVVDSLVAGGARTIKVQNNLSRDAYLAIADEARVRGVPYVGHVTATMTVREAARAGQHSIEHGTGLHDGCSREEAAIMRRRSEPSQSSDPEHRAALQRFIADTYDDSTCRSLATSLVEHDTWLVPTSVVKTIGTPDDGLRTGHRGYVYAPADARAVWDANRVPDSAAVAHARANFARSLRIIGLMARSGVSIMAGTDVTNSWLTYGFSLQDELALMTAAGLSPLEALRTATLNPARFLQVTDSLGDVATGQIADLVLLDANPLIDIHNTQRIRAVLRAGHLYDRTALDSLLARARLVADSMR